MTRDYLSIRLKKNKIVIATMLMIVLAIAFLVRLTPIIHIYWINYVTALILSNGISIAVISILLIALQLVELKQFREKERKEKEFNGN